MNISVLSSIFIRVELKARYIGTAPDPTINPVFAAFVAPEADPVGGDWHAGVWDPTATRLVPAAAPNLESTAYFYAKILVGPNGLAVPAGRYKMWGRATNASEVPTQPVDDVTFF